ncbi:MAG: CARDB domain-containing protein, partial [Promethearchaeota archaeon]
ESTGDYDTGYRETGDLISTPINLVSPEFASLEFYHWREGEGYGYDASLVYISTNGVSWDLIYENDGTYTAPWEKVSVDISAYVGNPSVQLRFTFDTYDDIMNDYRGWLIDDVAIMGTGVVIPHNLRVILEVPENPEVSKSYNINATVTNIGTSDETNINLFLYENRLPVDSLYITNLLSGSSQTINYFWIPTSYGDYNFTAFAPPVSGEEITYDNLVTKLVPLHEVILFDGMYIDYSFNLANMYIGSTQVSYTQLSGSKFHTIWEGVLSGSPLINHWDVDTQTRVIENGDGNFYFGDSHHTPIWIFTDISISDVVYIAVDGEGDHTFLVSGDIIYDIPDFGPVEAWILEDLSLPGGIAYYEKSTGILLKGIFCYYGGLFNYTFDLAQTNVQFNRLVFDHDLRVNLVTPSFCEIYKTYTISATIINTGTNDETGVDLFLYLDGVLIDSVHISSLVSGSSQTIDYSWTPTNYGVYNFSAYAPPVIGETYTSDNTRTTIIHLHKITLFDGMFLNYSFTLWGASYPLEYLYSDASNGIFHVDYSLYVGGPPQTGYWDVDSQTRVMSNSYGGISFGSATHTPLWIHTDISLNDVITIAVDAEGDHSFTVSDEVTYYVPGVGSVDAWVLEDSDVSGGIAFYEKITGILLNGTFFFTGGANNYSFEILNTNAFVKSLTVAAPDSSSSCTAGTSEDICWTSRGLITNVKIELYKDDAFVMVISSNTPNDGVFAWAIPSNLAASTQYQIKISDVADPSISDFSEYFEIKSAGEGGVSGYNIIFFITMLGVFSLIVAFRKRKRET